MVPVNSLRTFPVFTHHTKELQAAAQYLVRRMEAYADSRTPDEKFHALLARHKDVIHTLYALENTRAPFVYVTQEEQDLVKRISAWLKDHPEHRMLWDIIYFASAESAGNALPAVP